MDTAYHNFYRQFYRKTGFIPSKPLNQNIYPGDFFQIHDGEIIVLGNIIRNNVIAAHECRLEYGIKLNPASWSFSDGVTKPYSGRGTGHTDLDGEFEYSRQLLAFAAQGSFYFRGNEPESFKISNWGEIQQQLIIRLTQTIYSFRDIYVVTESALASDWALAISGSANGELEIATDAENFGLVDIFGHHSAKTIQSKDIEYYHRETRRKPTFFKARKLAVQDEKMEVFISDLISQRMGVNSWASDFFAYDLHYDPVYTSSIPGHAQASVLDMLQANQLNPNTALYYFKWADTSLDDIEKLF